MVTFHNVSECETDVHGQVILTIKPLALLHFLTDLELHLATETEQDQMRLPLLQ
jgi:hypothetical protein